MNIFLEYLSNNAVLLLIGSCIGYLFVKVRFLRDDLKDANKQIEILRSQKCHYLTRDDYEIQSGYFKLSLETRLTRIETLLEKEKNTK